jgi:hypothetical protein
MAMVALLAFVAWRLVRSVAKAADAPTPWFVPAVIAVARHGRPFCESS